QPAQAQVGLGQKVARTAGRVKEGQRSELALKGAQPGVFGALDRDRADFIQLRFQIVQKQWIDDLVNVLNARVVHPAVAAGFRAKRTLKHRVENCRADLRPVEILAGPGQNQIPDFIGEGRYLDVLIGKKPAVHIGEGGQIGVIVFQVRVTV